MNWRHEFEALVSLTNCDQIIWTDSELEDYDFKYNNIHLIYSLGRQEIRDMRILDTKSVGALVHKCDSEKLNKELFNAVLNQKTRLSLPIFWQTLGIQYDELGTIKANLS